MTTSHICIMIAIIVYLGAMIYVGYLCSKKNNDTSDFYLGGRKVRTICNGNECRGFRYEQLAFDGTSGSGLSVRNRRCRMDCDRTCNRNVS